MPTDAEWQALLTRVEHLERNASVSGVRLDSLVQLTTAEVAGLAVALHDEVLPRLDRLSDATLDNATLLRAIARKLGVDDDGEAGTSGR